MKNVMDLFNSSIDWDDLDELEEKLCTKCDLYKLLTEFPKDRNKKDGYYSSCRDCHASKQREYLQDPINLNKHVVTKKQWAKDNRSKLNAREREKYVSGQHRQYSLKRKYDITVREWNWLFLSQGYRCAICRTNNPKTRKGWSTDHNHITGDLRSILCYPCNWAVGHVEKGWLVKIPEIEHYLEVYA